MNTTQIVDIINTHFEKTACATLRDKTTVCEGKRKLPESVSSRRALWAVAGFTNTSSFLSSKKVSEFSSMVDEVRWFKLTLFSVCSQAAEQPVANLKSSDLSGKAAESF
ncbi:hypothetical protein WN943_025029 [Citrus x changshan-huyou]